MCLKYFRVKSASLSALIVTCRSQGTAEGPSLELEESESSRPNSKQIFRKLKVKALALRLQGVWHEILLISYIYPIDLDSTET